MTTKPQTSKDVARSVPLSPQVIERRIFLVRGHKVMLDSDLAELYEVKTKVLNQAVRRNLDRFPDDFMFELSAGGSRVFEVTICDLKDRTWREAF